ncbi:MAG: DinB family protein [Cyclobacteriaceae bacterium]
MEVNFEKLLQSSNEQKHFIEKEVATLPSEVINWKESKSVWSVLEVVSHLNQVYELYTPNFIKALDSAPQSGNEAQKKQSTILGKLSVYSMKPKSGKRKYKMTTFKFFEPSISAAAPNETVERFIINKDQFNGFIKQARTCDLTGIKMPTALGKRVKFFIPEIFEFLLTHEERHLVQIQEILDKHRS